MLLPPEWLGFATGVSYVLLAARQSIFCWPVSLVNLTVYFFVFWNASLFADALLQIFYLFLTVYGWWSWTRRGQRTVVVHRLSRRQWLWTLSSGIFGTILIGTLLVGYGRSEVAWWDAHTTAVSLVAQALTGRKILENWFFWIWANVFYVGLYIYKGLTLTAALYALFLLLAVYGYRQWRSSWRVNA